MSQTLRGSIATNDTTAGKMSLSDYNYMPEEEAALVRKQFKDAYAHFSQHAFKGDDPVMCQLHDVFDTLETNHHNCLGCNFADSIQLIKAFLRMHASQETVQFSYTTYLILCYLLVERIELMFDIIALHKEYKTDHFKILTTIRRWANFIKHPKAFLLTHHAEYTYQDSPKSGDLTDNATEVINHTFIDNYYSNEKKNEKLYEELENKEKVLVVFPDVNKVTEELCSAINKSVGVVCDNVVFREVLAKRSTFRDYWIDTAAT